LRLADLNEAVWISQCAAEGRRGFAGNRDKLPGGLVPDVQNALKRGGRDWNYFKELIFCRPMDVPETGGGRLAAVLVILVALFGVAMGSKWLIVTTEWGIWAVLASLIIIALGFVVANWRVKSK
jgi:hypothetical protein